MNKGDQKLWTYHQTDNVSNLLVGHSRQDFLRKSICSKLKKGKILEIGFGDGYLLSTLADRFECFGSDISEENVKNKAIELEKVKFSTIGTDGKLPFDNNFFDAFVASEVLEHMSDAELDICVGEVYRILKSNGYCFITVPGEENLAENECFCPNCERKFHKWGHKQCWTENKLKKIFSQFEIVQIKKRCFSNPNLNIFGKIEVMVKKMALKFHNVSGFNYVVIAKKK